MKQPINMENAIKQKSVTTKRLRDEIQSLQQRANFNLIMGSVFSSLGLGFLVYFIFTTGA